MAARAVSRRLEFRGRRAPNFAGRELTGARGWQTAAAHGLTLMQGGRAPGVEDLLRRSSFALNLGGDGAAGSGLNLWGGGDYLAAEGESDGIDYDGNYGALHFGLDAAWRRGLIGVAVSMGDAATDYTVTTAAKGAGAAGVSGELEAGVTSVHPYITREFARGKLYLTVGYGSGDADVKEAPGAAIETDISVATAAVGLTRAPTDLLTLRFGALYNRAELAAAERLAEVAVDATRVHAGLEITTRLRGRYLPFVSADLRHDSGDGDTGLAGDVGGGLEYRAPSITVRLAGAASASADGADERRLAFTARKTSGDFDLKLNLAADSTGLDAARLLTGEWRF